MTLLDAEIKQRRVDFGVCLKSLRLRAGLSQEKLAQTAEVDRKTISRIENGQLSPSLDICWAIAEVLKCDLYELFLPMAHQKLPKELAVKQR